MVGFNKIVSTWKKKKIENGTYTLYLYNFSFKIFLFALPFTAVVRYRICCGQQCRELRGQTALQDSQTMINILISVRKKKI